MVARLQASGMRSISLAVDVTNYVMLELGQPTHAFDLDKLEGAVRVRRAESGEKLETLDHVERILSPLRYRDCRLKVVRLDLPEPWVDSPQKLMRTPLILRLTAIICAYVYIIAMRVAIAGASGYAGGELLRLLENHPQFEVIAAAAHSSWENAWTRFIRPGSHFGGLGENVPRNSGPT